MHHRDTPTTGPSRHRRVRNRITAPLVALLLALAIAVPALASASKQGTVNCGLSFSVAVKSETTGIVTHYAPLGVFRGQWNNGTFLQVRYSYTSLTGTSTWKVDTTGTLYSPNTFGFCY